MRVCCCFWFCKEMVGEGERRKVKQVKAKDKGEKKKQIFNATTAALNLINALYDVLTTPRKKDNRVVKR